MNRTVATWTSISGKHWCELTHDEYGYSYTGSSGDGHLGNVPTNDAEAIAMVEPRAQCMQPDANKTPMQLSLIDANVGDAWLLANFGEDGLQERTQWN